MNAKTLFKTTATIFITITSFLLITHAAFTATNEWFEKGVALGKAGNYKEAIEAFTKAIEIDPNNATAYRNRGLAYKSLGNNEQAIQDYDKAIELNPQYLDAYISRGIAYCTLSNFEQGRRDFNMAIKLNPKDAGAYNNRGIAYKSLGNYAEAIQDYSKAIELNPKDSGTYYNRGVAYYKIDNYKRAIQDLNKTIEINPKGAGAYKDVYKGIGLAYYNLGNYKQAIQNFDKAIESNPNDEYNYLRSVIAGGYLSKEERTARLEQLSRYAVKNRSDAWVRTISMYYLEKITEKQLFAKAKQAKDAKETKGRFCEAYYYAGEAKLFNKDRKRALDYFTKAVETGVDNFIEYSQAKAAMKRMK